MQTKTDSRLATILFEVNCAAMAAMDEKLRELVPEHGADRLWIKDKLLPGLLPTIEATVVRALREVDDTLPETLDLDPAFVEMTRRQLVESLERVGKIEQ